MIARYRSRISGLLLDRIDLPVEVPALDAADLANASRGESSRAVRERARVREVHVAEALRYRDRPPPRA